MTPFPRTILHLRYAQWLEQERGDDDAPFLAHHYTEAAALADADVVWPGRDAEHADVRGRAASWLERAARIAYRRGAVHECALLLEQAVEMEPDAAARTGPLRSLAHAYAVLYNGEGFQRALEHAAALTDDAAVRGELIADLAYQSHFRPTLWQRAPDSTLVGRWVEEALALNQGPTAGRVKALAARVWADSASGLDAATEAVAIAEQLDSDALRCSAFIVSAEVTLAMNRPHEAYAWTGRLLALRDALDDPDDRGWIAWHAAFAAAATGRLDEARDHVLAHNAIVAGLTPHHVIHGFGLRTMIDEMAGRWDDLNATREGLEAAVSANAATRCHLDARALLACALATHLAGNTAEAVRLEALADAAMFPGTTGLTVEGPRLRLAIARGDGATIDRLLDAPNPYVSITAIGSTAARLDGLAFRDRRSELETIAPPLLQPGTYLEPFALRALAIVRHDPELLAQARTAFEALGLTWHATETTNQAGWRP